MSDRRRRLSASGRVAAAMTTMLAAGVATLCILAYTTVRTSLTAQIDTTLLHEATEFSATMRSSTAATSPIEASRQYLRNHLGVSTGADPILVVLSEGHIISNSEVKLEVAPGNNAAREPTSAPAGFSDVAVGASRYRVLSAPIAAADGHRVGLFQAGLSTDTATQIAFSVAGALAAAGIIVILGGAVASVGVARQSLQPLRQMALDAAAITHTTPGRRLAYNGPSDELGSLTDSLNAMLSRLERSYEDQRRFVADASHELRTPVAIMRGNVELLRRSSLCEQDATESLRLIEEESLRMTRLLDELLSLARLEGATRHFQPLEIRTLLDEIAAHTRALGDRHVTVQGASGLWASGDPDLLKQALLNIVRNAVAHTPQGGHITLACSAVGNRVFMTVSDDGPGIPPDDLERIFDRFFRAAGPRPGDSGGAGLGLAITSRLVDLHDGRIRAENLEPHGARFTIELPRIVAPA